MRPIILSGLFCLFVLLTAASALAAENTLSEFDYKTKTSQAQTEEASPAVATDKVYADLKISLERYRLLEIIAISIAVIALLAVVLKFLTRGHHSASQIINAGEVLFIIFGVILIVILADQEAHLTAPMGILGAVAGYLFGKFHKAEQIAPPVSPQGGGDGKTGAGDQ